MSETETTMKLSLTEQPEEETTELTLDDLAAITEERAQTYEFLARLYREEVDQVLFDELMEANYPVSSGSELIDSGYYQIAKYLSNAWVDPLMKLSVDYTKTFLGSGIDSYSAAYPFESVYTSEKRLLMQDARDEVLAIYRSCGLEKAESWKVGEDHIAVELEFMRVLSSRAAGALREGDEDAAYSLLNTQHNFMEDHLATWVPVFANEVRRFADTQFYCGLADLTEGFLEADAELLVDLVGSDAQ